MVLYSMVWYSIILYITTSTVYIDKMHCIELYSMVLYCIAQTSSTIYNNKMLPCISSKSCLNFYLVSQTLDSLVKL